MGVFYFLLLALVLWGIKINKEGFNEDYIEKGQVMQSKDSLL